MQVSGKLLVITTFVIGLLMASGAWWYNYQQSCLAAQFWGAEAATLIIGSDKVELLELVDNAGETRDTVANRAVHSSYDLTGKRGLVHLRHALTYDANFQWDDRYEAPISNLRKWTNALRFTKGDRQLCVLFTFDFKTLAKITALPPSSFPDSFKLEALPCPQLGPVILNYLMQPDVGALPPAPAK
jgi:hypothetical protein